jgi:hypothetical protein
VRSINTILFSVNCVKQNKKFAQSFGNIISHEQKLKQLITMCENCASLLELERESSSPTAADWQPLKNTAQDNYYYAIWLLHHQIHTEYNDITSGS